MIKEGSVVSMTYRLTNTAGEELDSADKSAPFMYLHGQGQIVPGLERELEGLATGAKKQVVVAPVDGYGEFEPELQTVARRDQFPADQALEVGMRFAADVGQEQPVVFMVVEVEGEEVTLDGNHPLAGETLHFDVEILEVRDATEEELAHGHAHGPDGHHHHD